MLMPTDVLSRLADMLLSRVYLSDGFLDRMHERQADRMLARCASVGSNVRLRMPLTIYHPELLSIGADVDIGEYTLIRAKGNVKIGSRVLVASHAMINSSTHPNSLPRYGVTVESPIIIGDDVWIGAGAAILPGVSVGDGSIVGAGAVVTKDVEPYTVVAGVPARPIGKVPI